MSVILRRRGRDCSGYSSLSGLLASGTDPDRVHQVPRSRTSYWRMSGVYIVRFALNDLWLEEQGVPDMDAVWIVPHYGAKASS